MPTIRYALILAAAAITALPCGALAQSVPTGVTGELAPTGKLRAAINLGNTVLAQKSKAGAFSGVSVELARELGKRVGVPVELIAYPSAGRVVDALQDQAWDVAFMAIEPRRAAQIAFSPPYAMIEGAYLIARSSPFKTPEDVDRPSMLVGVALNSAHDLFLTRTLKHATLVRVPTGGFRTAINLFHKGAVDAVAGTRQPLAAYARTNRGVRVMEKPFNAVGQAMGTPKGREAATRYVRDFIEEMKASGFVAAALKRSGQGAVPVAPQAKE